MTWHIFETRKVIKNLSTTFASLPRLRMLDAKFEAIPPKDVEGVALKADTDALQQISDSC